MCRDAVEARASGGRPCVGSTRGRRLGSSITLAMSSRNMLDYFGPVQMYKQKLFGPVQLQSAHTSSNSAMFFLFEKNPIYLPKL